MDGGVVFSALRNAIGDIFELDLETLEVVNLTHDDLADYSPLYAPDGQSIPVPDAGERQQQVVHARHRHG